jgi:hypothetical protein
MPPLQQQCMYHTTLDNSLSRCQMNEARPQDQQGRNNYLCLCQMNNARPPENQALNSYICLCLVVKEARPPDH